MSTEHGDRLPPAPAENGLSPGWPEAEHAAIDRAIAEHEIRQLAEELGYSPAVLTDGTIVCEPRPDPKCCGICRGAAGEHDRRHEGGDDCAKCGDELTVLTRCQRVVQHDGSLAFHLRFLCPKCYAIESAG